MDKKNLFRTAWQIARREAVRLSVSVRSVFGTALTRAWKEIRTMTSGTKINCDLNAVLAYGNVMSRGLTIADLPALAGTEKQVRWADTLRHDALVELLAYYGDMVRGWHRKSETYVDSISSMDEQFRFVASKLDKFTSAAWWIDNRNKINNLRSFIAIIAAA